MLARVLKGVDVAGAGIIGGKLRGGVDGIEGGVGRSLLVISDHFFNVAKVGEFFPGGLAFGVALPLDAVVEFSAFHLLADDALHDVELLDAGAPHNYYISQKSNSIA